MKRLLYSLAVVLMTGSGVMAQNFSCATDRYHQQLVERDPSLAKDLQQLIANSYHEKSGEDDSTVFVVPVVFHIIHQNGIENISDAQVFDAMSILNRDYAKLNADTADAIPAFDTIIGEVKIQFKLASYDPWGNCTNGIEHIYSHETNSGDANSKLNQWDRSRYLNVWVVRTMDAGTAGYAHYPSDVNGYGYWIDGIVLRHNYIGSIGTGTLNGSRALTHEVGHWLALQHTWGNNNDPGLVCGDDGVDDTPETKGYTYCPTNPEDSWICNDSVFENYQNYMDYSYCSVMFTLDQVRVMRHAIQGTDGQRNNLITPETHHATGIDLTTPPVCIPTPDIKSDRLMACVGESITFTDQSFNGPVTFREWSFQDGTPATSTSATQNVVFNSWGTKTITLTVGNASGQVTKTFTNFVDIQPDWAVTTGPKSYDLESATQYQELRYINDGNTYSSFVPASVGYNSSKSLKLTNYKDVSDALPATPESRYYGNLGGQVDAIITPTFDLRNTSGVTFSFDYAYTTNAVITDEMSEQIRVYYSRNCGDTWSPLGTSIQSTIEKAALASAGLGGGTDFTPEAASDWASWSRPFNVTSSDSKTRFKIEFTASDYSNNLYIDNIMISGVLGLSDDFSSEHELLISPNPVVSGSDLNIQYVAGNEPITFTLRNLQGEEIVSVVRNEVNQPVTFGFEIDENIAASYYFLEVKSATSSTVKKIAVIK